MPYIIATLIDLIDEADTEDLKKNLNEYLESFNCKKNLDIQNFLREKSILYEKQNNSVTYLILNDDTEILAFFTLAIKNLVVESKSEELSISKNLIRKLRGFGGSRTNEIPGILIGQLARNDRFSKENISGQQILRLVLNKIDEIQRQIGGRFILVDCITKLIPYYEDFDFTKVGKSNKLNKLVKLISE